MRAQRDARGGFGGFSGFLLTLTREVSDTFITIYPCLTVLWRRREPTHQIHQTHHLAPRALCAGGAA